jgi:hypothetical protein
MRKHPFPRTRWGATAGLAAFLLAAACFSDRNSTPVSLDRNLASWETTDDPGYVRACKVEGPAGDYTFTVSVQGGGDHVLIPDGSNGTVHFDGSTQACAVMYSPVLNDTWETGETAQITIAEIVPDGMTVTAIDAFNVMLPPPGFIETVTGTNTYTFTFKPGDRFKIRYHNSGSPPPPPLLGRVTGGGQQIQVGGATVSRGFTLHCDITLANNLEINWHDGNNFHITRPLTSADCFYDPDFDPRPPVAPINTFIGVAAGTLNGIEGATAYFTLIDDGESGKNDLARIRIYDHNNVLVLDIPLSLLDHGNIQMHYDQPHGSKPPKN